MPIPGTRNPDHLDENLGATALELTAADLADIAAALSGSRCTADECQHMEAVDRT